MKPEIQTVPDACRYLLAKFKEGFEPCHDAFRIKIRNDEPMYCSVGMLMLDSELEQLDETITRNPDGWTCREISGNVPMLSGRKMVPQDRDWLNFLEDLMEINDESVDARNSPEPIVKFLQQRLGEYS